MFLLIETGLVNVEIQTIAIDSRIITNYFSFLIMSLAFFVILFLFSPSSPLLIEEDYLSLSYQLLDAVKNKTSVESIKEKLAKVSLYELSEYLDNDTKRKTFWINIYNANIQLILSKSPELFEDRGKFFTKKLITIAQKEISFDDIEHGIIRGSKFKLALGLIKNPFPSNYEKQLRVKNWILEFILL